MDQDRWIKVKHIVNERDQGSCVKCQAGATDIHHRTPRGMGGTSDPEINYGLAGLVSLCRPCHGHVHANPAESYKNGLLVHSWEDPAACPITLANETVVIHLAADGTVRKYQQQALF